MKQTNTYKKSNLGQTLLCKPILSDYLKQEKLDLPSQVKRKKIDQDKDQLLSEIMFQEKQLLRNLRLQ